MDYEGQCDIILVNEVSRRRRQWQPTPVLLPGRSYVQRSLVDYSPWGLEEPDMTEWLHFPFSLSCVGEGNGSPLQYSCLENPRDSGAWWAAVYGVTQSQTRLKWLSSSRSKQNMDGKCLGKTACSRKHRSEWLHLVLNATMPECDLRNNLASLWKLAWWYVRIRIMAEQKQG